LWALAYSIKQTTDKQTIPIEVIETLGELLTDPEKNVKQTAAITLCYYADDEKTALSTEILARLADMLNETDYGLLSNILSVYLRLSKQKEDLPSAALKKLKIIEQVDGCLNDSEFNIRNPAAMIFLSYWTKQVEQDDEKLV
jgi:hypothetical protein